MKHRSYLLNAFLCVIFSVSILSSCNDDLNIDEPLVDQSKISLSDEGYLIFDSFDHFDETLKILNEEGNDLLEAELKSLKFTSMEDVFNAEVTKFNNEIENIEDVSEEEILSMSEALVQRYPGTFILSNTFLTMNLYRSDISALVNPNGYLKIGNILYKYSYSHIKSIADCEQGCDTILEEALESDDSISLFVSEVQRSYGDSNLRTSFEHRDSETRDKNCYDPSGEQTEYHELFGHVILARVSEPIYEEGTCVDYDEQGREFEYPCYKYVGSRMKNYFEATATNKKRQSCLWASWVNDARYHLRIYGHYYRNGVRYNFDRTSTTTTHQYKTTFFSVYNTSAIDISSADITFESPIDDGGFNRVNISF